MTSIKNPLYGKLRNTEHLQVMTNVLDIYRKYQTKATALQDRLVTFENAVKSMMDVLNDSKGVTFNGELKPLDDARIYAVRGLRWFLQSEVYRDRPDRSKHAKMLLQSFNQHCDDISRASFEHKTICITKMMDEWQTVPVFMEAIKALNAESWVEDVTNHNTIFNEKYLEKAESAEREVKTSQLRANLRAVYEEITKDTLALARVAPDKEVYEALVKSLNNVVSIKNESVEKRRSKRKKAKEPMPSLPVPV